MVLLGIKMNKFKCVFLVGIILVFCLASQSQEFLDYILIKEAIIVSEPSSIGHSIDVVLNPEWKTFKNNVFQFDYPPEFQIDGCKIKEGYTFFCRIVDGQDIASINYQPTKHFSLEEESSIEKSLLVAYTFEGEPCARGGEIYSVRNFVNLFGFECKELKIKDVVECYYTNKNGNVNGKSVEKITEHYDKPSMYTIKFYKDGRKAYFYLVPYWGNKILPNEILERIIQSVRAN